jgi:hypothetical protein
VELANAVEKLNNSSRFSQQKAQKPTKSPKANKSPVKADIIPA